MVTPINNNKMNKYNFIKVHSDYELKCGLDYIEAKLYKLVSTATLGNVIYLFYDQETS